MGILIRNPELEYGDVVLNFGNTLYEDAPVSNLSRAYVLRLMGYVLFANRVGLPTRHLLTSDALFRLITWAPELLKDGLLFPDLPEGVNTILENARAAQYPTEANWQERAIFLDEHARYIHAFDASGMMARFRSQILRDLGSSGPLRALLQAEHEDGDLTADSLARRMSDFAPARHDAFLEAARGAVPDATHDLIERWAAVRYYTVPMDFDICVRDIPHPAAELMIRSEALAPTYLEDPGIHGAAPEPMNTAIEIMSLDFPEVYGEGDAKALVQAVLRTREDVPEARRKFAAVVHVAFEDDLVSEINSTLRRHLVSERLLRTNSPSLSEGFKHAIKESAWSIALELATGPLGPFVGGYRAAALEANAHGRMAIDAPWKISCEYLRNAHERSRLGSLLQVGGH